MQSPNSNLVGLPQELLNNISSYLPTKDFNALRLVCKPIEDKIFPYWANCFFKKRQFMIDPFSLNALVDISRHEALSKVMTHLIIGLDEFKNVKEMALRKNFDDYRLWRSANCAQNTLLQTGVAIDLLSTALANLPNLKTIDLRDFDSPTRYRDVDETHPFRCWRSYGSSLHEQWKYRYHDRTCDAFDFASRIFKVILTALDRCSPELKSLEIVLKDRRKALIDDALAFFPALGSGLTRTLRGLTKLHLALLSERHVLHDQPHDNSDYYDPATTYLRSFIALTPNITWLRLNFTGCRLATNMTPRFLSWLSLKPDYIPPPNVLGWNEMNPAPVILPLRQLDLGNVCVSTHTLHKILTKFSNLEKFSLKRATLEETDDKSTGLCSFDDEGTDENGDSVWARLIRGLSVSAPNIKHLMLSDLRQKYRHHHQSVIFYKEGQTLSSQSVYNIDHSKLEELASITWTEQQLQTFLKRDRDLSGQRDEEDNEDLQEEEAIAV